MMASIHHTYPYQTEPFSRSRRCLQDILALGHGKHLIHGLVELDVTEPRRRMRQLRDRTGAAPSFTAFIIGCVAQAVAEDRRAHAYRDQGDRLIMFDDVDVSTMVEVERDGRRFPLGHILRSADKRPLAALHEEIRAVQNAPGKVAEALPGGAFVARLPAFLRRILLRFSLRRPHLMKKRAGTVLVTAVGMFGDGAGWGIPISMHTLTVTLGGIGQKPGIVGDQIQIRDYLSVTVSFDHDIVDGAPAARFTRRLRELVESGYGLPPEISLPAFTPTVTIRTSVRSTGGERTHSERVAKDGTRARHPGSR
jgi:hypothetical protein